jgi:transposase
VRIIQRDFIAIGVEAFEDRKRGRKAPQLMSFEEEEALLSGLEKAAKDGSMLVAAEIKAAWEAKLGRPVHKTTLYRMLKRHGWRKVVPRPKHPKQNKDAGEAFKKGASQAGWQKQKARGYH